MFQSQRPARPALAEIRPERICLIKPSALGDVVQALPVLTALRMHYPDSYIAWVVNRSYADLLSGHPHLNEVIAFDRGAAGAGLVEAWKAFQDLCERLRASEFDLVLDLQGLLRSGWMAGASGAARRVGLEDCREGAGFFYTDLVSIPPRIESAVERYWRMIELLGAGSVSKQFVLALGAEEEEWADRQLRQCPGLSVAIHAGARWSTKRWPAENFAGIARRIRAEYGAQILLVGGSDAAADAAQIEARLPGGCLNLVGRTSLKQLAAVLKRVPLLVTNDSGPMHLAAALGTRVAAIFTCTSPVRARPYGAGHAIVASQLWCAASYLKNCSRLECMVELTADRVWPAVSNQLREIAGGAAA